MVRSTFLGLVFIIFTLLNVSRETILNKLIPSCENVSRETFYLPIQNCENILFKISSLVTSPIISPNSLSAFLKIHRNKLSAKFSYQ